MSKSHESKQLSREKTLRQLYKAPAKLRSVLTRWLNKKMAPRDASERFLKANPSALKVTDAQTRLMLQAHAAGVSFRALENIFHLRCQSGNSAQRCVRRASASLKPVKKKSSAVMVHAVA